MDHVGVDNTTIGYNLSEQLEIKDGGLTVVKISNSALNKKTASLSDDDTHLVTSGKALEELNKKIDTAGTGLSKSGTTLNHSNSISAQTTAKLGIIKYDAQGHITGFTEKAVINNLTSTATDQPLSAYQGKILNDYNALKIIASTNETEQAAGAEPFSNYITPNNSRITFSTAKTSKIIKKGNCYQLIAYFKFTTTKGEWAANTEWLNIFTTPSSSTKMSVIAPYGWAGTFRDTNNGDYGGQIMFYPGGITAGAWPWKKITTSGLTNLEFMLTANWIS